MRKLALDLSHGEVKEITLILLLPTRESFIFFVGWGERKGMVESLPGASLRRCKIKFLIEIQILIFLFCYLKV